MYPFELARLHVSDCPECGCADVERIGRHGGNYRYACVEGHQFEVPKPPSLWTRWRRKGHGDEQLEPVDAQTKD